MKTMLLGAAMLAVATPSYAQVTQDAYDRGVTLRTRGDAAGALPYLQQAAREQPRNSDPQVQLGLAYLALGQLDEAEAAFRATLVLAPEYTDAQIGLADVARRRGERRQALEMLAAVDPAYPGVQQRLTDWSVIDPSERRWRLDLDGGISDLTRGQSNWYEAAAGLSYRVEDGLNVGGRIEYARRNGLNDVYGEVRVDHRLSDRASGYLLFGATPNADFRPRWQIGGGGGYRLTDGGNATVATIDLRQGRYRAGSIQTVSPGIEQYLLGGRAYLSARWINIFDGVGDHRSGYSIRGDIDASERLHLFAGFADAPDVSEGIVIPTRSLFGGARIAINDTHALRLSVAHDNRQRIADRTTINVGVTFAF